MPASHKVHTFGLVSLSSSLPSVQRSSNLFVEITYASHVLRSLINMQRGMRLKKDTKIANFFLD